MTLVTGSQLKAARALAEIDQQALAMAAEVNVNTIRNMEAYAGAPINSGVLILRKVQVALEALGIQFLNHGEPGVRLLSIKPPGPAMPAVEPPKAGSARRKRGSSKT